ncbi:MAG: hypothetical protein Q9214_001286 [Letrouitia sp. 1 TL-2023]
MNGAVRAHRHRCPQHVRAFRGPGAQCQDIGDGGGRGGRIVARVARGGGFTEADGGLEGELVERVEGVLDVGGLNGGAGGVDASMFATSKEHSHGHDIPVPAVQQHILSSRMADSRNSTYSLALRSQV